MRSSKTKLALRNVNKQTISKYAYNNYIIPTLQNQNDLILYDELKNYIGKYVLYVSRFDWQNVISIVKVDNITAEEYSNYKFFISETIELRNQRGNTLTYNIKPKYKLRSILNERDSKYVYKLDLPLKKYLHDTMRLIQRKGKTNGKICDLYK